MLCGFDGWFSDCVVCWCVVCVFVWLVYCYVCFFLGSLLFNGLL